MENRLTEHHIYPDGQHGYEALGHDAFSQRPFIEITKKLALYEDTGYTPKEVAELRDKLLGNTADDWMGMYHIAADRADKAEAEVERLRNLHDKSLVRMSIAETQNINLLAKLAKYKRAFDLACSNLSAQIDGLYCPADAIDFDLDINYCDNCYTNDYSVCWADFYLQQAEREAVKNEKSKP